MNPTIEGVAITPLRQIVDERGAVLHMLRTDSPHYRGFGECYFSEVRPRAVKAWKRHTRQTQNLAVPVGSVRFVICDDRPGSPTRGARQVIELGRPDHYVRLTIPPELWYGFTCLGESAALVTNCADIPHEPGESEARTPEDFGDPAAFLLLTHGISTP